MTLKTRLTSRAVALVAACGTALGLASVPALAAPTITVTGVVTDADGNPLEGISVYGFQGVMPGFDDELDEEELEDEAEAELGDTDAEGRFTYTSRIGAAQEWGYGFTTGSPWTFVYSDGDQAQSQPFQIETFEQESLVEGRNELPTMAMRLGGVIDGSLQTPSGKPIVGADLEMFNGAEAFGGFPSYGVTGAAGAYRFTGLRPGEYGYTVYFDDAEDFIEAELPRTTLVSQSEVKEDVVITTKVPCTRTISMSSPSRKTLKVSIRATGKSWGVNIPGGTVNVKRGTTTILRSKPLSTTSSLTTLTLKSQPTGKQKYTVSYAGGDCRPWTAVRATVSVRK